MDYNQLADLLFPQITKTPANYEADYPPRDLPEGAKVTRLGPSPTGFIHLGNLYGAFVDERQMCIRDRSTAHCRRTRRSGRHSTHLKRNDTDLLEYRVWRLHRTIQFLYGRREIFARVF